MLYFFFFIFFLYKYVLHLAIEANAPLIDSVHVGRG